MGITKFAIWWRFLARRLEALFAGRSPEMPLYRTTRPEFERRPLLRRGAKQKDRLAAVYHFFFDGDGPV